MISDVFGCQGPKKGTLSLGRTVRKNLGGL